MSLDLFVLYISHVTNGDYEPYSPSPRFVYGSQTFLQ
jgi:hypothetical protein